MAPSSGRGGLTSSRIRAEVAAASGQRGDEPAQAVTEPDDRDAAAPQVPTAPAARSVPGPATSGTAGGPDLQGPGPRAKRRAASYTARSPAGRYARGRPAVDQWHLRLVAPPTHDASGRPGCMLGRFLLLLETGAALRGAAPVSRFKPGSGARRTARYGLRSRSRRLSCGMRTGWVRRQPQVRRPAVRRSSLSRWPCQRCVRAAARSSTPTTRWSPRSGRPRSRIATRLHASTLTGRRCCSPAALVALPGVS